MWLRAATRPVSFIVCPTLPSALWGTNVQRRCKATSSVIGARSQKNFRTGTVGSAPFHVKSKISVPLWQPSAKYMRYKPIRWISNNLLAIAAYQMALEVSFTIIFGSLLYAEKITAQGVYDELSARHYPFMDWVDVEGGVYTQPLQVGPFTLNAQKITALHTGHNIANGLLPLQVLLLATTFVPAQRACRLIREALLTTVGASHVVSGAGGIEAAAAKSTAKAHLSTSAQPVARRASYTRATSTKNLPSTSPLDQGNKRG